MYRLKPAENEFQVIREGEFEYHNFKHGEKYEKVPDEERERFEQINQEETGDKS